MLSPYPFGSKNRAFRPFIRILVLDHAHRRRQKVSAHGLLKQYGNSLSTPHGITSRYTVNGKGELD